MQLRVITVLNHTVIWFEQCQEFEPRECPAISSFLNNKESRFPAPAYGGRRLRSTAYHQRTTPLVPLASLDLPNRGRRVACGSLMCILSVCR